MPNFEAADFAKAQVSSGDQLQGTPDKPWCKNSEEILGALFSDQEFGLTTEESLVRIKRFGRNELKGEAAIPKWRKFLGQFNDPLIYLLLAAVVVSFVAWILEGREGTPFEVIVILSIVIMNAILVSCRKPERSRRLLNYKR